MSGLATLPLIRNAGLASSFAANPVAAPAKSSFIDRNKTFNYQPLKTNAISVSSNKINPNALSSLSSSDTPWYQDGGALSGYAGLASALMQAVQLPEQMKIAKIQRRGLEQNLAQAKEDSALQRTARSNLNASMMTNPNKSGG